MNSLHEKLTAKEAIKRRCADCNDVKCADDSCELFGLAKPHRGADRTAAIRRYCCWCMDGNPVHQCSCVNCAIHKYRGALQGNHRIDFEQSKPVTVPPSRARKGKVDINDHPAKQTLKKRAISQGV
ncbi:hypothetical protein, partial [Treponema endosymbiont of Eucomonympha sp.]|uniref:hypothetical protein n=1 Tax=Treponema endosymbiont of Eucomonympha sp. TaxID=1580831 RepID=UPI001EE6AC7F